MSDTARTITRPQGDDGLPAEQEGDKAVNLLALLHRLFRGRYLVAAPLIVLGAMGAGVAGYFAGGPVYTSTAVVRVRPVLPKILYSTELADTPEGVRFENYVSTQARLFTTDRLLRRALEDPDLHPDAVENGVLGLRRALDVKTEREAPELIFVNATTPEPAIAQSVVEAAVGAYIELYGDESSLSRPETINTLEDLRRQKQAEIRTKTNQIKTLSEEWGSEDLGPLHELQLERVSSLRDQLAQLQTRLIELRAARDRQLAIEEDLSSLDDRSIQELTELFPDSPRIATLAAQRSRYEGTLRELKASGILEANIRYRGVQRSLEQVDRQIRDHARQLVQDRSISESLATDIELTESRIERLEQTTAEARNEAARIAGTRSQIEERRKEIETIQSDLARINQRLDAITLESKVEDFSDVGGRISVISEGNLPTEPSGDTRRKLAAFGFVAGGGAVFSLFALIGLIDRRVRYSDDILTPGIMPPLLAVVPRWKPGAGDTLLPAAIANIIHRLRSLIEVKRGPARPMPIVITSGLPGEGKTSLVLSLGISYAHAGSRVLLLDLDPIGRSLTRQIGVRPETTLTSALLGDHPERAAIPSPIPGLDIIGATDTDETIAARLNPAALERCFSRLADRYDVVLVDTGPLIGGVESTLACAQAEGVVVVVGRGTSQRLVEQCNAQLRSLGARVLGLVFNGATRADFGQSPSSQSYSSRGSARIPSNGTVRATHPQRWCPNLDRASLAEAVASTLIVEPKGDPDRASRQENPGDDLD